MCGIFGIYNIKKFDFQLDVQLFHDSLVKMAHRGPDSSAVELLSDNVAFGHVRLSIIDHDSSSNQPFYDIEKEYCLIFNGEIYNYLELKSELKSLGVQFYTNSDTEVLLESFKIWGEECVMRFNGMWSFAIYRFSDKSLFCSRDRFGVKPFNYSLCNGVFSFSSEIKSMINYFPDLKKPNFEIIANFCRFSSGAQFEQTWFQDILRLPPAHNLLLKDGDMIVKRYWDYPRKINKSITFEEAKKEYLRIFSDSVRLRLRSDVPIGYTLSSGLDSTSIVATARKFIPSDGDTHTYTAVFNSSKNFAGENKNYRNIDGINEGGIVEKFTNDYEFDSKLVDVGFDNYSAKLSKLIWHLESGHASPAIVSLDQVLLEARKDVTVLLEGQGADELMGGYIVNVLPTKLLSLIKNFQFKKVIVELRLYLKDYSLLSTLKLFLRNNLNPSLIGIIYRVNGTDRLYTKQLKIRKFKRATQRLDKDFDDDLNRRLFIEHTGGLVNLLHYGDAVSMKHSLESRLPFMDFRLVEFLFTLPMDFKLNEGMGKFIHRKVMDGILPNYITENRLKFGFENPLHEIFLSDDFGMPKSILLSEKFHERGLFSRKQVVKYLDGLGSGNVDKARFLYRILCVELWFREFIDAK